MHATGTSRPGKNVVGVQNAGPATALTLATLARFVRLNTSTRKLAACPSGNASRFSIRRSTLPNDEKAAVSQCAYHQQLPSSLATQQRGPSQASDLLSLESDPFGSKF